MNKPLISDFSYSQIFTYRKKQMACYSNYSLQDLVRDDDIDKDWSLGNNGESLVSYEKERFKGEKELRKRIKD